MNKIVVAVIIVILAVAGVAFASVFKDLPKENPEPEAIEISTLEELKAMKSGNRYVLTSDISMVGETASLPYAKLNGNGHSITGFTKPLFQYNVSLENIRLQGSASGIKVGLLSANGGSVHLNNVQVTGELTTSGVDPCGGIAPFMYGSIKGSTIDIKITGKAPAAEIAGTCSFIEFENTNIRGSVQSERHASGIVYMIGTKDSGGSLTFRDTVLSTVTDSAGSASGIAKTTETKNLRLEGLTFKDCVIRGTQEVGIIFSQLNLKLSLGSFIYENAKVEGEQYVGGLFGKVKKVMLEDISNDEGLIVIGLKTAYKDAYIGGITGYSNWTVKKCSNYARVDNQGNGNYTGGIIGYLESPFLLDSINKGKVTSKGDNVGGIAGCVFADTATSNGLMGDINYADVSGKKGVGGLFGFITRTRLIPDVVVSSCVNLGNISGMSSVAQIVGDDSYSKLRNCSEEGSVS